ncbi:MAG: menaquinone biosynthesis protein [Firmicutes bacterium]|nr:menaquinone biosynthesis protein [Bacillota bacterium]
MDDRDIGKGAGPLRLGRVDYLNCLPVYDALERGEIPLAAELVYGTPAELNRLFRRGEVDIAPISSFAYAEFTLQAGGAESDRPYVLPDLSISCDGPVGSILLFSKRSLADLDAAAVSLTTSSASSVALLKILMAEKGVRPRYETAAPDLGRMLGSAEAALLIGDEALKGLERVGESSGISVYDLGQEWKTLTGERMVFAVWAVRPESVRERPGDVAAVLRSLQASRDIGLTRRDTLADRSAGAEGYPPGFIRRYFRLLRYDLDPSARRGFELFAGMAGAHGLLGGSCGGPRPGDAGGEGCSGNGRGNGPALLRIWDAEVGDACGTR